MPFTSLYESAFASLPIGSCFLSPEPDPVILAVNDAFLRATRREREEVSGKRLFEVFPESPDDPRGVAALRQSIKTVLDTRQPHTLSAQHFPIPVTQPDGTQQFEERYWNAVNTPVFDKQGQLIFISHVTIDVTKQTLAEIRLRQSEERFRSLVNATSDVVWLADANGEMTKSQSWSAFTGQMGEEWQHEGWARAIHPNDREQALSVWKKCLEEQCLYEVEMRIRRFDGQYRCMDVRAVPVLNADGSMREWVGFSRDITATKDAQEQVRENADRVRLATDAANLGIWVWDLETDQVRWENQRLFNMFGLLPSQEPVSVSRFLSDFIHPDDRAAYEEVLFSTVRTGIPLQYAGRFYRQCDRALCWFEFTALLHYDEEGKPIRVIGTAVDITEKKRAEEELRIANERLNMAMEGAGEGVWEWNFDESGRYYSPQVKDILGYEEGEMPQGVASWYALIHPDDRARVESTFLDYQGDQDSAPYTCEYRMKTKDGGWKWVLSRGKIVSHDADGKPMRMVGMVSDISLRKETDERIWQLANYDPLTGLPNRRLFKDRLRHEVANAQRKDHVLALFFIDLDRFKEVNDLSGHDVGDLLLVQAAHRLKDLVRDSDTVARLGGDEFTIILPGLHNADHVEQIAQKVLDELAEPFSINEEKVYVSGSVGIALYPEDAASSDELISKADQAMYAAKRAGKNQFSYFTKEMDEKAHRRLRLIRELHHAVQSGQMKVYYQPVVDLHDGQIIKAEALVRWDHPTFGKVDPSYFIPLAEEGGMIDTIGNYVFREAAETAHRWGSKLGKPLQISINKSPIQFSTKRQNHWLQHLRELGLSPSCVAIEITEGALLHASDNVSNTLLEYRDAGIQVAIDDFGTGYSSMAYLQRLDIDYLKIDQSFTRDMTTNKGNRTIVESMVVMAHKLGLKVIAEGVETKEQMAMLQELECDYGQGYLFSKPLPLEDFEALLMSDKSGFANVALH